MEVIIECSIRKSQSYFSLHQSKASLMPLFITVLFKHDVIVDT